MKLLIVGATRGTGRCLLDQALEQENDVTVLVRDQSRLSVTHPKLSVVVGDVLDPEAVKRAVPGQDAVLTCLGAPVFAKTKVRGQGHENNIVQAMKEAGVQRLVSLSALGAAESRETLPFWMRYIVFPTFFGRVMVDTDVQEKVVRESGLDWTLVRPPQLTNKPAAGSYKHGFKDCKDLKYTISRADVAAFMLDELSSNRYVQRAVGISD